MGVERRLLLAIVVPLLSTSTSVSTGNASNLFEHGMGLNWWQTGVEGDGNDHDACREVLGEAADTEKNPAAVRGAISVCLSFSALSLCSVEDLQTDE